MISRRPVRILQVLGSLGRWGIETWLMHVLHHLDRDRFHIDFLTHTDQAGAYDEEARALGAQVIPCLRPGQPLRYARSFRRILRKSGPYDVVHSHVHHFTGFVLRLAAKEGTPVRIAHSHLDTSVADSRASLPRRAYLGLMNRWLDRHATDRLACGEQAGRALFGVRGRGRPWWRVLPCGLDFEPFHEPVEPTSVRAELGIPEGAHVIGHVGRLHEQKNHHFLIEIMAELARRDPNVVLLLVGDGPLQAEIEREVAQRSLRDRVVLAGSRADVPRLMLGAMDVFVFPSHYEGLPLAAVEAQAAGLPCLLSDAITEEVSVVAPLVRRLALTQPAAAWADAVVAARARGSAVCRTEARAAVERSPFSIHRSVEQLQQLYETARAPEEMTRV